MFRLESRLPGTYILCLQAQHTDFPWTAIGRQGRIIVTTSRAFVYCSPFFVTQTALVHTVARIATSLYILFESETLSRVCFEPQRNVSHGASDISQDALYREDVRFNSQGLNEREPHQEIATGWSHFESLEESLLCLSKLLGCFFKMGGVFF